MVSEDFPYEVAEFDTVYSASVFHIIPDDTELWEYLNNAYITLDEDGVFIGSTLGVEEGTLLSPGRWGPPRVLTRTQLEKYLTEAGFSSPTLVRREHTHHQVNEQEDLCYFEF